MATPHTDMKEEIKRIKKLTTSVLTASPALQDNTSEMISNISVLLQNIGDTKKG